jgi:hypothetical protein
MLRYRLLSGGLLFPSMMGFSGYCPCEGANVLHHACAIYPLACKLEAPLIKNKRHCWRKYQLFASFQTDCVTVALHFWRERQSQGVKRAL